MERPGDQNLQELKDSQLLLATKIIDKLEEQEPKELKALQRILTSKNQIKTRINQLEEPNEKDAFIRVQKGKQAIIIQGIADRKFEGKKEEAHAYVSRFLGNTHLRQEIENRI